MGQQSGAGAIAWALPAAGRDDVVVVVGGDFESHVADFGRHHFVVDRAGICEQYAKATNIWPEVYTSQPGPGAYVIAFEQ